MHRCVQPRQNPRIDAVKSLTLSRSPAYPSRLCMQTPMVCMQIKSFAPYLRREPFMKTAATCLAFLVLVLLPAPLLAQATLTGTVRDNSGAVLPGVTVEAASPALIEKTRSAVTDGTGQYRIIDLRPGTYELTFTLTGFTTVKRGGVELSGTQTATIAIEMRVGGVAETITVVGETPVVDTQNVKREMVLAAETIQAIPAARAVGSLLNTIPGLTVDTNALAASPTMTFFSARGGPAGEGRMAVNGMVVAAANGGG